MSEPELTAIFKLQFYRKQKNWVFNRKGETRRKDEKKGKGDSRKRERPAALNQTYTVKEAPSNLNEAFLETGPNAPGEDTADSKKIDPDLCSKDDQLHEIPDIPWADDHNPPANQHGHVNINNNYTGPNKYPNLNLTQNLQHTKDGTESLTLSKASISLNKLRHFEMEDAEDNKGSSELVGDLAQTCPTFGPIVQSLWMQYEASKGVDGSMKGWPRETAVWTNAEHNAMDYEDSDLGHPCGDSQDITDGVNPISYLDIPFLPPGLPLPPSLARQPPGLPHRPPGLMMHQPPPPIASMNDPQQDPRTFSHCDYDQPLLSKQVERAKADSDNMFNEQATTYNPAQFMENQAQMPLSREEAMMIKDGCLNMFMGYQSQGSMTRNQARNLLNHQLQMQYQSQDNTTYNPTQMSFQNSNNNAQPTNNYMQDRRTSNNYIQAQTPVNKLNDDQTFINYNINNPMSATSNDRPWSPSKPSPAHSNKPSPTPTSVSKASLESNLQSKTQPTSDHSASKTHVSVTIVNTAVGTPGMGRVSPGAGDWGAGVAPRGADDRTEGRQPGPGVPNRELLKQHLDRLRLQDCCVAPDLAHRPPPNYPHYTRPTECPLTTMEAAHPPATIDYSHVTTEYPRETSEYSQRQLLHESVSSASVDSEAFMAGAQRAAHSSEIELCDRVLMEPPREFLPHRPPSMQQYYDRQTPSFDELPTRDVGPTVQPTLAKQDVFLAGSFRDVAVFDGCVGRGRGRLARTGVGKWRS